MVGGDPECREGGKKGSGKKASSSPPSHCSSRQVRGFHKNWPACRAVLTAPTSPGSSEARSSPWRSGGLGRGTPSKPCRRAWRQPTQSQPQLAVDPRETISIIPHGPENPTSEVYSCENHDKAAKVRNMTAKLHEKAAKVKIVQSICGRNFPAKPLLSAHLNSRGGVHLGSPKVFVKILSGYFYSSPRATGKHAPVTLARESSTAQRLFAGRGVPHLDSCAFFFWTRRAASPLHHVSRKKQAQQT